MSITIEGGRTSLANSGGEFLPALPLRERDSTAEYSEGLWVVRNTLGTIAVTAESRLQREHNRQLLNIAALGIYVARNGSEIVFDEDSPIPKGLSAGYSVDKVCGSKLRVNTDYLRLPIDAPERRLRRFEQELVGQIATTHAQETLDTMDRAQALNLGDLDIRLEPVE